MGQNVTAASAPPPLTCTDLDWLRRHAALDVFEEHLLDLQPRKKTLFIYMTPL
jgi:hypothetical protein